MTDEERDTLANAWAQASGAQVVLLAMMFEIKARGDRQLLEKTFEQAGETVLNAAYHENPRLKDHGLRMLQVIDHMRSTVLGPSVPQQPSS